MLMKRAAGFWNNTPPPTPAVIFGQWGDKPAIGRWLAAPLISHRMADGVLAFTPDLSRPEADQLVLGLNHVAELQKKQLQ
jgi:hypothetical protein